MRKKAKEKCFFAFFNFLGPIIIIISATFSDVITHTFFQQYIHQPISRDSLDLDRFTSTKSQPAGGPPIMHLSSLCSLYFPCAYDIIVVINLFLFLSRYPCSGVTVPVVPSFLPSQLIDALSESGSGSDGGFLLLKGSFFFPHSGREIKSKRSFCAICLFAQPTFLKLALYV